MKLRICVLFPYDLGSNEGPNRVVLNLIRSWKEGGNEVTLVTAWRQTLTIPGVRYVYARVNMALYDLLRFCVWVPRSRREFMSFDVVVDAGCTITMYLYQRLFRGRTVYFQSHQNKYMYTRLARLSAFSRFRAFYQDYLLALLATRIIAVSRMHMKSLVRLYGKARKFRVVQNGVSLTDFHRTGSKRANKVLFIGNLGVHLHTKEVPTLLKAFTRLARTSDCVLVVAGKPNPELEPKCAELGIADRVTYAGWLDKKGLLELYNSSKVLVLPSVMDADGLVVKEAMACGTPVIVSEGVGSADAVKAARAGLTFPVSDDVALYRCMKAILEDDRLASELGDNGRVYAETYLGWDRVAEEYLSVFRADAEQRELQEQRAEAPRAAVPISEPLPIEYPIARAEGTGRVQALGGGNFWGKLLKILSGV